MTRRLRRFATALLGLLLLQTSALEGSLACLMPPAAGGAAAGAPERGNATAATYGAADDHAGHDRHAGRSSADTDGSAPDGQRQSRHHGTRDHCPSSMSCAAVAIATATASDGDGAIQAAARIGASRASAPSSVVRGPEPPPPRA